MKRRSRAEFGVGLLALLEPLNGRVRRRSLLLGWPRGRRCSIGGLLGRKFDASAGQNGLALIPPRADGRRRDLPPFRRLSIRWRAEIGKRAIGILLRRLVFHVVLPIATSRHYLACVGHAVVQQEHDHLDLALPRIRSLLASLGFFEFPFLDFLGQWFGLWPATRLLDPAIGSAIIGGPLLLPNRNCWCHCSLAGAVSALEQTCNWENSESQLTARSLVLGRAFH